MNLVYLSNNIKMAQKKNISIVFCDYSKFAEQILEILKQTEYIVNYEKENYKLKISLNGKIKYIKVIKPRVGFNSQKLFKLYKNIYLGSGYLIITNSRDGVTIYKPENKMAGIPLIYVSV